jgi:hypothetical protein
VAGDSGSEEEPNEALDEHGDLGSAQLAAAVQSIDEDDRDLRDRECRVPGPDHDFHLERVPLTPPPRLISALLLQVIGLRECESVEPG